MNVLRRGRALLAAALLAMLPVAAPAQTASSEKGPAVGRPAPAFRARDQFGREQTLETLAGPNGLVLLFFRSADW